MSNTAYGSDQSQYTQPLPPPTGNPYLPPSQPDQVNLVTKPKKSRKTLIVATSVGVIAFFVGMSIGSSGGAPATASAPAITQTVAGPAGETVEVPGPTVTQTIEVPGPVKTVTKPAAPAAPPAAATAFGDGQHEVGTDIQPGRYKTKVPAEDIGGIMGCYIDVQKAGDYLAQEITQKGHTYVTIPKSAKGAIVDSNNCGEWTKVG